MVSTKMAESIVILQTEIKEFDQLQNISLIWNMRQQKTYIIKKENATVISMVVSLKFKEGVW